MTLQILNHADTNEISDIANSTILELQKKDWIKDLYLNASLDRLKIEADVLTAAVGVALRNDFAQELMVQDAIFNQVFIGFKQFVLANTFSLVRETGRNADMIWAIIEAHDVNLYRLSYEQQIFLCQSLLNELDRSINKAAVASLDGVSTRVDLLREHNDRLRELLEESKADETVKAEGIAASIQKHVVRDILNKDLLPYMVVMNKAKAEAYGKSFRAISDYITEINNRVKARQIYKGKQMEESLP